jgi:AcrR family transcriptional regulator
MRQIAKRAGIALGGIYNHFAGKEAIFREVFLAYHPYQEVLPFLEQASGITLEELLHSAAEQMQVAIAKRPHFLNLLFIEVVEFKNIHTRELFNELLPRSEAILKRLKSTAEKLRPIPDPILIRSFIGLYFSYYITELILNNAAPPAFRKDALRHFVNIYLHGILEG